MIPALLGLWLAVAAAAPEPLALPGFRLHVAVSEDVEPDRLEALARPGVVLWLETRSNLLKRSISERVGGFDLAYIQVRAPWTSGVREQLTGRVHPRVSEEGLDVAAYRRWAPAGTAVDVDGALTQERVERVLTLRPLAVRWRPEGVPTAEEWARAAHLPGLEIHPTVALPPCEQPLKRAERMRLRLPPEQAATSGQGCGLTLRLEIPPASSEAELRALLVAHPGAELWVHLGTDADAAAAAGLLALLTAAVPPTPKRPPQKAR